MTGTLTRAEAIALRAVADRRVHRTYRANGNTFKVPHGFAAATFWRLEAKGLIRDGAGGRGYNPIYPVELTATGKAALSAERLR